MSESRTLAEDKMHTRLPEKVMQVATLKCRKV